MKVLLVLAVAIVFAGALEMQDVEDPSELGEWDVAGQTPAPTMPTPTDGIQDQDADKTTAECYANSWEEANAHCNSKDTEEQCSGAMADWYCNYESELNCDDRDTQKMMCAKYNTGPTAGQKKDAWFVAKCCTWSQAQADQLDGALGGGEFAGLANGQMDGGEWELTQIPGSVAQNSPPSDLTPPCTFNIQAATDSVDGGACPSITAVEPATPLDLSCGGPGKPECLSGRRRAPTTTLGK